MQTEGDFMVVLESGASYWYSNLHIELEQTRKGITMMTKIRGIEEFKHRIRRIVLVVLFRECDDFVRSTIGEVLQT
jgi:hypothetical protein